MISSMQKKGATVTITTHYGVYTYEVTETKILDYQDCVRLRLLPRRMKI